MEKKEQRIQDNILFLGNRDDVYRLYQAMDVFVLPSRYEGLPVVGVEAQAAGLPCVLSDKMTKETKITEVTDFMNIENSTTEWADRIINLANYNRCDITYDIKFNKFCIRNQVEEVLRFYEGLWE